MSNLRSYYRSNCRDSLLQSYPKLCILKINYLANTTLFSFSVSQISHTSSSQTSLSGYGFYTSHSNVSSVWIKHSKVYDRALLYTCSTKPRKTETRMNPIQKFGCYVKPHWEHSPGSHSLTSFSSDTNSSSNSSSSESEFVLTTFYLHNTVYWRISRNYSDDRLYYKNCEYRYANSNYHFLT